MYENLKEEEDEEFVVDDLTVALVSRASGANEPTYVTRGSRRRKVGSSSRVDKGKSPMVLNVEDDEDEEDIGVENDSIEEDEEHFDDVELIEDSD